MLRVDGVPLVHFHVAGIMLGALDLSLWESTQ